MEVRVSQIEKRSWMEINISQLKANYFHYKQALRRDAEIMAVIKADAYGHGDIQVARMLADVGVRLFAVSNIDEAIGLREAGIKGEILILGYSSLVYINTLFKYDLTQTIVSEEYADALISSGVSVKCQLAIDTGMNRIGLDGKDTLSCERVIRKCADCLNLTGIFTHLCVADSSKESDVAFTRMQIRQFKDIVDKIEDLQLPYIHCCNSAGGLNYLSVDKEFDTIGKIVRLGIVLYGLKPDNGSILPQGIAPAMTWKSAISMVKDVVAGETIGYGRTYEVTRPMRIATVTTGYADGLNRLLSNRGFVMIDGKKAPIVGRVCMDQTLVDVTDIPNVKMGDKVVLLGRSGELYYSADDMAQELGTIGYEILCNITKRVQRFYINAHNNL